MEPRRADPLCDHARPFEPQSNVVFGRFRQRLAINAHKTAPSTGQWLQVRVWDTLVRESPSSGPLFDDLTPAKSAKELKERAFQGIL